MVHAHKIRVILATAAIVIAAVNIITSSSISLANDNKLSLMPIHDAKKYKVYCHNSDVKDCYLCQPSLNHSTKLVQTNDLHARSVIWTTSDLKAVLPLANESIQIRLERDYGHSNMTNMSQSFLNGIDPDWKLFFIEYSDLGVGDWVSYQTANPKYDDQTSYFVFASTSPNEQGFWFMKTHLVPLIGWKRIHYITRATQNKRFMDRCVDQNMTRNLDECLGARINFTDNIGEPCASVQRYHFTVRDEVAEAMDEYIRKQQNQSTSVPMDNNAWDHSLGWHTASFVRDTDVRTFWNKDVCNSFCSFRNHVADFVATIGERDPSISVNTDVVGFIRKKGRAKIHQDYIKAMLSTKIIVLAQRDRWEDHMRLEEALLSGALVMTDPQLYYSYGIALDGEKHNIVVYHSMEDLEIKIKYYLKPENEQERIRIGVRARELALSHRRFWQQGERLILNNMQHRNEYGLFNKELIKRSAP